VKRYDFDGGFAFAFDAAKSLTFEVDGVRFVGRTGGVLVDRKAGTTRVVVDDGAEASVGKLKATGCVGPYDVTFGRDRITGRHTGLGRFLYLTQPPGLDRLPMLVIDGQTHAPGTSGRTLIVPLMPGEHSFEIRPLPQPPIFRNWQAW